MGNRHLGQPAAGRLGCAGIDPPLLITADDVTRGKPHPHGYLLAARRLNVPPEECLVIEDSPAGVAAGRAAGAFTAGLRGIDCDLPLTDLHQMANLLTGLHSGISGPGESNERANAEARY